MARVMERVSFASTYGSASGAWTASDQLLLQVQGLSWAQPSLMPRASAAILGLNLVLALRASTSASALTLSMFTFALCAR